MMTHFYDLWLFVLIAFTFCSRGHDPIRHFQFQVYGVSIPEDGVQHRVKRQSGYDEQTSGFGRNPPGINQPQAPRSPVRPSGASQGVSGNYYTTRQNIRPLPSQMQTTRKDYEGNQQPGLVPNQAPASQTSNKAKGRSQKAKSKTNKYYYPPRMPLPLPSCFHNPTGIIVIALKSFLGYVCCNRELNDLIVDTYTELEVRPKFHVCNINALAKHLQLRAQEHFSTDFETIVSFEDFAQKIHFKNDLVCKVEVGGKYMLAYGTVRDVVTKLPPQEVSGGLRFKRNTNSTVAFV